MKLLTLLFTILLFGPNHQVQALVDKSPAMICESSIQVQDPQYELYIQTIGVIDPTFPMTVNIQMDIHWDDGLLEQLEYDGNAQALGQEGLITFSDGSIVLKRKSKLEIDGILYFRDSIEELKCSPAL